MQCFSSKWWRIWSQIMMLALLAAVGVQAQAVQSAATVKAVKLEPAKPPLAKGWSLSADFQIELGDKLREVVEKGLPLQFAIDFKLTRPRWYWTDEEIVSTNYPFSLSYHALTRTYRLITPDATLTFSQLDEAIAAMSHIQQWLVIPKDAIQSGEKYNARVRFRLLLTEMPKPFQISALVNTEWDLSTDWLEFDFTPHSETLR